jgi:site-specific recombinase XerD
MQKPSATLSPLDHRGATHIKVDIANDLESKNRIKKIAGRKWSQTHGCWYVPYSKEAFRQLKESFEVTLPPAFSNHQKKTQPTATTPVVAEAPADQLIIIERENDLRVKAFVPRDRKDWIEKIRTIPGRAWNEQEKYWSLPFVKTTVKNLTDWFGKYLQWGFPIPDNLLETYLPKGWKQHPTPIKGSFSSQQYQAPQFKRVSSGPPKPMPAASVNKLNIQPNASPNLLTYQVNGLDLQKVVGEKVVIVKRGDHFLEAYIPHDKKGWVGQIREIPGRTWSPEAKCWRLPYVVETVKMIYRSFGDHAVFSFRPSDPIPWEWADKPSPTKKFQPLLPAHKECLIALEEQLMLERKSHSTIKSYKESLRRFLEHHRDTAPAAINETQIKNYLLFLAKEKGVTVSTQNKVISAIKAFFEKVLKQEKKTYYIPRPKKDKTLPSIFSEREVANLINAVDNTKHQYILMIIYSAGLRIGEAVNLKIRDLDLDRRRIFIHAGKGKKDRYTLLAQKAILHLQKYIKEYKPDDWLFEGQSGGQYSKSSIQKIFKKACRKAGIIKPVTVHSLRHSFATHLHDKGISLRHIQDLLGHESPKTTEIYTHLTTKGFDQLKSPLDHLDI